MEWFIVSCSPSESSKQLKEQLNNPKMFQFDQLPLDAHPIQRQTYKRRICF